jgi:hypothetical protein
LLFAVVLTAQLCVCKAYIGVSDGFSVELIHRDSVTTGISRYADGQQPSA